jgi:cobalt-zinc-cadmium efflux system protein
MAHDHHRSAAAADRGRLAVVFAITLAVLVVEVVGAALSGSLALLADAGHVLADLVGVGLALLAIRFAARPATPQRTFGYYRLEILAAVVNAVLLFGVAGFVLVEAWRRLAEPPEVASGLMLAVAAAGLVANAGFQAADPIASAVIGLAILPRTWRLLREAVDVLLEAAPKGVDLDEVRRHLLETPGVTDVHDLHVWTITSGLPVLSAHVVLERGGDAGKVLDGLGDCLAGHFDIEHSTFQLEQPEHRGHEGATHR